MPAPTLPPLAELVAQARTLLAARKDEESTASAAADWLAGLGGASKWGPLEAELARVSALADSEASRQRAASLVRSLGGTVAGVSGDAGDAGARASANTVERATAESAAEAYDAAAKGARAAAQTAGAGFLAIPGAKGLAVGLASLAVASVVGGPAGVVVGLLGLVAGYEVEKHAA